MNKDVRVPNLSVVQEAACRSYLIALRVRYPQQALIEFSSLMVADLACLRHCRTHIARSEVAKIACLAASLAVLMAEQFYAPSLDGSLETLAFRDSYYVNLLTVFPDIIDCYLGPQSFTGPFQFLRGCSPNEIEFHDLGRFARSAADQLWLCCCDYPNFDEFARKECIISCLIESYSSLGYSASSLGWLSALRSIPLSTSRIG